MLWKTRANSFPLERQERAVFSTHVDTHDQPERCFGRSPFLSRAKNSWKLYVELQVAEISDVQVFFKDALLWPATFVASSRWSKESNEDFTSAVSPLACLRRCFCIELLFLRVFDHRVFKSRRPSSNTLNRWKQRSGKALQALAGKEQTVFELLKTTLNTRFFSHKTPINKNVGKTKFRRNHSITSRCKRLHHQWN